MKWAFVCYGPEMILANSSSSSRTNMDSRVMPPPKEAIMSSIYPTRTKEVQRLPTAAKA